MREWIALLFQLRSIVFYGIWISAVRLVTLTLITFFVISPTSKFQDISDALSSHEMSLMGLSAFLFLSLLQGLNPLKRPGQVEIFSRYRIEKQFLPGFTRGALIAGGFATLFLITGTYRYLGFLIQLEEAPFEVLNVLFRIAALCTLVYCEEFLFREKIPRLIKPFFKPYLPSFVIPHFIAILYCGIKLIQFDFGRFNFDPLSFGQMISTLMQIATLYLVSLSLSFRHQNGEPFARGAGLWAALLVVFHPLLSLPIFGSEFNGILILKVPTTMNGLVSFHLDPYNQFIRLISGGIGGPLSSFTFQLLLILDIGRSILKRKKRV